MTILEQRFLESVPVRLSEITKELKQMNTILDHLLNQIKGPQQEEEDE